MIKNITNRIVIILIVLSLALWIDLSTEKISIPNPFNAGTNIFERDVALRLGLDLRGGCKSCLRRMCPKTRVSTGMIWKQPAGSLRTVPTPWV